MTKILLEVLEKGNALPAYVWMEGLDGLEEEIFPFPTMLFMDINQPLYDEELASIFVWALKAHRILSALYTALALEDIKFLNFLDKIPTKKWLRRVYNRELMLTDESLREEVEE